VNKSEINIKNEDKSKNYQAPTISISRKSSIRTLDSSKSRSKFQSFLRKPTKVRTIRNKTQKIRLARSSDMNNTSKALDRSFRNKNMLRKRRKQPSESIDNNRNENGRNGTTLQLFSNCAGSTNKSFNSKIVCHKKYNSNISQARKVNVSHTEIAAKVTSRAAKLQKAPDSAISQQNIKLIEQKQNITTCLTSRRTSGILRPNTSLGRNHSLFDNSKKYNYSYIQTKRPNEHLMSQPS